MPAIKQVEETNAKLAAVQKEVADVFSVAKDAEGRHDFRLASEKSTHASVKGKSSREIAEFIAAKNAEMNALGSELKALVEAEKALGNLAEPVNTGMVHPGTGGEKDKRIEHKSIGQRVEEHAAFKDFVAKGAPRGAGVTIQLSDVWPSELLGKAASFDTIRTKTLMETTAGWAPESVRLPGFVEMVTRPIQLLDIIPLARTSQAAVKYMEETTRTHNAAEKAEGVAFAESVFAFTEQSQAVQKITDSLPVTDEQLEDVAQVAGYINDRLGFGIRQRLDLQVMLGDGSAPNLKGITDHSIQTQAKGSDPTFDAFYKAMTLIRVTGRAIPTHHVVHPTDWQDVKLTRTADGIYIMGNPMEAGVERLWGLPVVQFDGGSAGTGYTGSFMPAWCSLFERRGLDIQVGYVGDQFKEGKRTVRADMRAAMVTFRPAAFCSVTGI